jgi:hypothetical protein
MRKLVIIFASLASLAGCQYRDGLYCMKHPSDLGNCGRNDGGPDGMVGAHIGGTVNGLKGNGLVLQNNGTDDYPIFGNGTGGAVSFQFPDVLPFGSTYAVTVTQQPANPLQTCTVTNGTGTANTDVNSVDVTCTTPSFAIGGNVGGLNATGLSLHNASTNEDLPITPNGGLTVPFAFQMKEPSGAGYNVTIGAQPGAGNCSLQGGQGTVGTGDVGTIVVNCAANQYIVYGNVSGLQGSVVLKDTNTNPADSDTVTVNANGSFAFTKTITTAETYAISVMTNPTYNAMTGSLQQTCNPSNASGTAPSVNAASVSCTTNTYTIGGSISGLTGGTVTLQDNAGDNLNRNSNGGFTFATRIASGSTYAVTVLTQPSITLKCTVANGSGTVTSNNITNVSVTCMTVDPGIKCGGAYCDPATQVCCDPEGTMGGANCQNNAAGSCGGQQVLGCDDFADCGGNACCAPENGSNKLMGDIVCAASATCASGAETLCDPSLGGAACPPGKSCMNVITSDLSSPVQYHACR